MAPNDAPVRSDPCQFDEINDDVLQEAFELNKINPVLKYTLDDMAVDVCDELEHENINEDETEDIQIHQKSCEIEPNNKKDDETAGIGINMEVTNGEALDHENNNIGGYILVTDTAVVTKRGVINCSLKIYAVFHCRLSGCPTGYVLVRT